MKIKVVHVMNFRKIIDAEINMEDNITVIAGANNSGKTSLVELFNAVFGSQKGKFCKDDIPAEACYNWSEQVYPVFATAFQSGKKQGETLEDIFAQIEEAIVIPPITLRVEVDYDKDQDDIRYFADYIMEFSPENTSFYFVYRYGINNQDFRKAVDAVYEKLSTRFRKLTGNADEDQRTICMIKEMLIDLYVSACEETAWFTDHAYMNAVEMEISAFK